MVSRADASSPGSNRSCGIIMLTCPSCLMVNSWSDSWVSFPVLVRCFMLQLCTLHTAIQSAMIFTTLSRLKWMFLCPVFFAATLLVSWIVLLIVGGWHTMTTHGRVSRRSLHFLIHQRLLISGVTSTLRDLPSPGPGGMRLQPHVLTLSGVPMPGSLLCHPLSFL